MKQRLLESYVSDSTPKRPDVELRIYSERVELRDGEQPVASGHASVFDRQSENLGGFTEFIGRGAFDNTDFSDVRGLLNHDPSLLLGRTTSGTVRLEVDDVGLRYEIDLPDTQTGRDLRVLMERGDITQSSFAFYIARDGSTWDEDEDSGALVRTITDISRVVDVSPVTYPAYPDTQVGLRELRAWQDAKATAQAEVQRLVREEMALRTRLLERQVRFRRTGRRE